jgi:ornithine cyclodeaminase/alanine dehydrogenase-like protein (mu-crystallin family)
MMMMDNTTGMIMVMDPENGKMYSATGMTMVMDPETGKVMIMDRRCGMASISVMDILKVFTPC